MNEYIKFKHMLWQVFLFRSRMKYAELKLCIFVPKLYIFWYVMLCTLIEVYCLPSYSLTLKMEAVSYSEMPVKLYQATCRHIPDSNTVHSHCQETIK
jgi:hypothetical protein